MEDSMWLRLLCAMLAGMALGFERESHGRAAGLRTTVLVCIAPCIGMLLSEWFYRGSLDVLSSSGWRPDPTRLAAGVLAGMGFIGAGVIIKQGELVRGVTTASVLWLASFLGMAFGSGLYAVGFMGLAAAMLTVIGFPYLERWVHADWYSVMIVTLSSDAITAQSIGELLLKHGVQVKQVAVDYETETRAKTLTLRLRYKKRDLLHLPEELIGEVAKLPGVRKISCN